MVECLSLIVACTLPEFIDRIDVRNELKSTRNLPMRWSLPLFSKTKNRYGFDEVGNSGLFSLSSTKWMVRKRNVSNDGFPWSLTAKMISYLYVWSGRLNVVTEFDWKRFAYLDCFFRSNGRMVRSSPDASSMLKSSVSWTIWLLTCKWYLIFPLSPVSLS